MQRSGIEWTDFTVNPIRARNRETGAVGHYCEHDGPECSNCYAETWNSRTRPAGNQLHGTGLPYRPGSLDRLELFLDDDVLSEVSRHRKPARFFWCSMTDLASSFVPDAWLDRLMGVVREKTDLTHQILTKRPDRLRDYFDGRGETLPPNLWVGATAGRQDRAGEKLPPLLEIPAAVRFVSAEPLLGPLDLTPWLGRLHWVIVGAESGPGSRPAEVGWVRSLVRQCQAAGVAVFVKQLGKYVRDEAAGRRLPLKMRDRKGGDPAEWPEDLRVREYPSC
jgi:protein gp37